MSKNSKGFTTVYRGKLGGAIQCRLPYGSYGNIGVSKLGWAPKTSLNALVEGMSGSGYSASKRDSLVNAAHYQAYDRHE